MIRHLQKPRTGGEKTVRFAFSCLYLAVRIGQMLLARVGLASAQTYQAETQVTGLHDPSQQPSCETASSLLFNAKTFNWRFPK
jgi:hypothetical protein